MQGLSNFWDIDPCSYQVFTSDEIPSPNSSFLIYPIIVSLCATW